MAMRKVIQIDEEKCDGCGQCVPACAEGAIQVLDGKARLVSETYCDGLGACLGECPQGAITMEERQAPDFDPQAVALHLKRLPIMSEPGRGNPISQPNHGAAGCPGSASRSIGRDGTPQATAAPHTPAATQPQLSNWPVQLHLAPVQAPYFSGADLLLAADCAPFAFADFHSRFIAGKKLLIACPKLDDTAAYAVKLREIFTLNDIRSVEIAIMEVPCCSGLLRLVQRAVAESGKTVPLSVARLGIRGEILQRSDLTIGLPAVG